MNTDINASLRTHQVERSEPLAVLHKYLRLIIDRFYPNVPLPAISWEPAHWRNLGWYVKQDGLALCHRISLNSLYGTRPLPEILRTLAHEVGHLWQQVYGKPAKPAFENYHNAEFRLKMQSIGIPCNKRGVSLGLEEPFVSFLRELGIGAKEEALPFKQEIETAPARSRSRLKPWSCGCTRVWTSAGKVVVAACLKCSKLFQPQTDHLLIDILDTLREVQKLIDEESR